MKINIAQPDIGDEEIQKVAEILKSGTLASGPQVKEFEKQFAAFVGTERSLAVSSGTAALMIAMQAIGIGPGDEVITVPFTFIATVNSILYAGAQPVFVDVLETDFNMNPSALESAITPHTKAVLPVDLYGQTADMAPIIVLCQKRGLVLIEDACQAHGARYQGQMAGGFGIGTFSFYPTKNMTTGEGGMITLNDADLAWKCDLIRNHGQVQRYYYDSIGYNFRMTDIAAALGIVQLGKLQFNNARRKENASFYLQALKNIPGLILPAELSGREHVWHQFTIRVTPECKVTRDTLVSQLAERGIGTAIYYPLPVHQQAWLKSLGGWGEFPVAERLSREVLSIPIHPRLSQTELEQVVESIWEICG